jgi:hypothetical protein
MPQLRPGPSGSTSSPSARRPGVGTRRTEAVARPTGATTVEEGERRSPRGRGRSDSGGAPADLWRQNLCGKQWGMVRTDIDEETRRKMKGSGGSPVSLGAEDIGVVEAFADGKNWRRNGVVGRGAQGGSALACVAPKGIAGRQRCSDVMHAWR